MLRRLRVTRLQELLAIALRVRLGAIEIGLRLLDAQAIERVRLREHRRRRVEPGEDEVALARGALLRQQRVELLRGRVVLRRERRVERARGSAGPVRCFAAT